MDDNDENDLLEPDIIALLRDPSLWQEPGAGPLRLRREVTCMG